jgi:hypothetical protein
LKLLDGIERTADHPNLTGLLTRTWESVASPRNAAFVLIESVENEERDLMYSDRKQTKSRATGSNDPKVVKLDTII